MMWRLSIALGLLAGGVRFAHSGERELGGADIVKRAQQVIEQPKLLSGFAERFSARNLRHVLRSVAKQVAESNAASPELVSAFTAAFGKVATSPADVLEVMGAQVNKTPVRQVFYCRYREQWVFEHPLRVCVVFDCVRGMDARVMAVFPAPEPR